MKIKGTAKLLDTIIEKDKGDDLMIITNRNYNSYLIYGTSFNVDVVWNCDTEYYYKDCYKNVTLDMFLNFREEFINAIELCINDIENYNETSLDKDYFYLSVNDFSYEEEEDEDLIFTEQKSNGMLNIAEAKYFISKYENYKLMKKLEEKFKAKDKEKVKKI